MVPISVFWSLILWSSEVKPVGEYYLREQISWFYHNVHKTPALVRIREMFGYVKQYILYGAGREFHLMHSEKAMNIIK
jgi:hypothetical protein